MLLAGAYALGTVNRWREGGWRRRCTRRRGSPEPRCSSARGAGRGRLARSSGLLLVAAAARLALAGLALAFAGFLAEAGGGGWRWCRPSSSCSTLVVRLGSNVVSFARLAAFGLTHAALGLLVWDGTTGAVAARRPGHRVRPWCVFAVGNALAFGLEALVAGVQALRLEYYELFSRVFDRRAGRSGPGTCPSRDRAGPPVSPH